MTQKILVAAVALMVTRDAMTILPATVPAHEVDIQRAVFGEDNVEVLEQQAEPFELETENEVSRLQAKYGSDALERAYGVNFKGAIGKALKVSTVAAGGAEAKPLEAMTKAELLAEAEKRGVAVDAAMNKAQIIDAIEGAAAANT